MSAFTVDTAHIDTIVNAMRQYAGVPVPTGAERNIGQMLWDENFASVNYRYRENESAPVYAPTLTDEPLSPIAVLKALDCYEYQSCEHPGWEESDARKLCDAIRGIIFTDHPDWGQTVNRYGYDQRRYTMLPEYGAAPWEVTSLDQVAAVIVKAEQDKTAEETRTAGMGTVYREIGRLDVVEIAKRMRVNLRNAQAVGMLPEGATFSVTTERYAGGQSVDVEVRGMPDAWTYVPAEPGQYGHGHYTDAAHRTIEAVRGMLSEYNRDDSDSMTDYYSVWFHPSVTIESESHAKWRIEDAAKRKARAAARKARKR